MIMEFTTKAYKQHTSWVIVIPKKILNHEGIDLVKDLIKVRIEKANGDKE